MDTSFGNSVDEGGGGRVKLGKAESAEVVLLSLTRAVADPTQRSQGWCPCGCRMWPGRRRERAEESRKEESLSTQLRTLTAKCKEAEARAEFAERLERKLAKSQHWSPSWL